MTDQIDVIAALEHIEAQIHTTSGANNDTRSYPPTVYRRAIDELRWLRARNAALEAEAKNKKKN